MTASPTDDHASAERRIQELTRELSQARGELAESREQQAATAEILRAISSSPTDPQDVFSEIVAAAVRLCDAHNATVYQMDSDSLRRTAHHGSTRAGQRGQVKLPLTRGSVAGRAVLDRRPVHVVDLQAEAEQYPETRGFALRLGLRSVLAVPLIRAGATSGVISIRRTEVRP